MQVVAGAHEAPTHLAEQRFFKEPSGGWERVERGQREASISTQMGKKIVGHNEIMEKKNLSSILL